ncbi:MAG TPA: NAD-dependent epimerase/dehydratase family protein [Gammaproteobacteria bacterium]|nr:NAD-dependent epimerase/dehydratase family protein [Gammaproteobacteria bacterium]
MRVAVTGASGFIGRHVVRELISKDVDVIITSRAPESRCAPIEGVTYTSLDMGENTNDAFQRMGQPDVLVHLAWSGLPNYRSESHLTAEFPKQYAFLESCVNSGLKRLVVTGTCLEYGMQPGMLHEELPSKPCTAYGQAKDQLRHYLQELAPRKGLQLTWLRLFYLYGPGQASTSLYSQLRTAISEGRSEFEMSPGDQQRDFIPVESAADYICNIALLDEDIGLMNICSGVPKKITDLVEAWLRDWNADIHLKLGVYPYPDYEPHAFWGNKQKLDSVMAKIKNRRDHRGIT